MVPERAGTVFVYKLFGTHEGTLISIVPFLLGATSCHIMTEKVRCERELFPHSDSRWLFRIVAARKGHLPALMPKTASFASSCTETVLRANNSSQVHCRSSSLSFAPRFDESELMQYERESTSLGVGRRGDKPPFVPFLLEKLRAADLGKRRATSFVDERRYRAKDCVKIIVLC